MKAIVSNHKRSAIYSQELTFEGLKKFIEAEFPRMKEASLKFTDSKGEEVKIVSEEDVALLKKIYDGQNFVEVQLQGKHKGKGKGHGHEDDHAQKHGHRRRNNQEKPLQSKEKGGINRKERRVTVLSKVYGGETNQYEAFVQENDALKMGQLIKAYAEKNGLEHIEKDKGARKTKILSRAFGGAPEDYIEFYQGNEKLKVGELIQKYSQQKGVEPMGRKSEDEKKIEVRIQKKIERLSFVLGNPHEVYEEASALVRENSKLNVKQILEKLEKEGKKVNFEKFREMRRKQENKRKERFGSKDKNQSPQKEEQYEELTLAELKIESQPKPEEKINKKQAESREKGRILMEMKQIFGNERSAEYFKFINQHFQEGEAAIIEGWIKTHEI